ncbi:MAG: phospholipase D family protein [Candidatus Omnitrophica bacterium]|nr:phospholipase D family protein [Candidatus Omnitrophota bacterium]
MPFKSQAFLLFLLLILLASYSLRAEDIAPLSVTVLFSPEDDCGRRILQCIEGAKESMELAIYHITSRPLAQALVRAKERGVTVRVFIDGDNADDQYSKATYLKRSGLDVLTEKGVGLMHNKFCIIDDKIVITGSFNWTNSADLKNDENLLIIESEKIARKYRLQFEKYWLGTYKDESYYVNRNSLEKMK